MERNDVIQVYLSISWYCSLHLLPFLAVALVWEFPYESFTVQDLLEIICYVLRQLEACNCLLKSSFTTEPLGPSIPTMGGRVLINDLN
jgi:hypothetical protein